MSSYDICTTQVRPLNRFDLTPVVNICIAVTEICIVARVLGYLFTPPPVPHHDSAG